MHVLLVDDNESVRAVIRRRLERLGCQVTEAGDGEVALRLQRSILADTLLTDMVMPGKEGVATVRDFRKEFPDMRIVGMSGGGVGEAGTYLKIALAMGADSVLAKPFSGEELAKALGLPPD